MPDSVRRLATQLARLEQQVHTLATVPQLPNSSIDGYGIPVYADDGTLTAKIGKQDDGSWGAPPLAGPVPAEPKGVQAVGTSGGIEVTWAGATTTGRIPLDFDAVEVLADDELIGAIHNSAGGRVLLPMAPGTYTVTARTRSQVPVHSDPVSVAIVTVLPAADVLAQQLSEGLATASHMNTISTSEPGEADGYPAGALWTRVELVEGDLVERARWVIHNGQWEPAGLDATTLTTGTVDAALIDVIALAAKMVTSGLIRTAATGPRVVLDGTGVQVWEADEDGRDKLRTVLGTTGDAFSSGNTHVTQQGVTTPAVDTRALTVGGQPLADVVRSVASRLVAVGRRTTDSNYRTATSRLIEVSALLQAGRMYSIEAAPFRAAARSQAQADAVTELWYCKGPRTGTWARGTYLKSRLPSGAYDGQAAGGRMLIDTTGWDPTTQFSVQIRLTGEGAAVRAMGDYAWPILLEIYDRGPAVADTALIFNDPTDGASAGDTGTAPPPVVSRSLARDSGRYQTYWTQAGGTTSDSDVVQGSYSGSGAQSRSGMWFFPDLTADLTGATITAAALYVRVNSTWAYSGGTLRPTFHGWQNPPGTKPGMTYLGDPIGVSAGQTVRVPIPPNLYGSLVSGAIRGFGVEASNASQDQYVRLSPAATVAIDYRK